MIDSLVGKRVIGIKQSTKAIKNSKGAVLYVAKDADNKLIDPLITLAIDSKIMVVEINNMKELGRICGIDVKSAAVLILE